MADPLNDPFESFVSQIKKGSTPLIKQDSSIIVDDKEPSAIGGLAALGATALGTGLIARRIPGVRAFLQKTKEKPNMSYTPTKTCLLYTSPSPRDRQKSRMPSSA